MSSTYLYIMRVLSFVVPFVVERSESGINASTEHICADSTGLSTEPPAAQLTAGFLIIENKMVSPHVVKMRQEYLCYYKSKIQFTTLKVYTANIVATYRTLKT